MLAMGSKWGLPFPGGGEKSQRLDKQAEDCDDGLQPRTLPAGVRCPSATLSRGQLSYLAVPGPGRAGIRGPSVFAARWSASDTHAA
jgi:hypothetical protein